MNANLKRYLPMLAAFAAGIVIGAWWMADRKPTPAAEEQSAEVSDEIPATVSDAEISSTVNTVEVNGGEEPTPEDPVSATVEVVTDNSPSPSPAITAAHRARQAKRALARSAREANRRDFLASLNLDLLTPEQQKLHAEYTEAVATRDAIRKEMSALRAKGEEIPEDLQRNLADAVSVVRADAAEEHRALREAASRAAGLEEKNIKQLLDDLDSVDSVFERPSRHSAH